MLMLIILHSKKKNDARSLSNLKSWKNLYSDSRKGEDVALLPDAENDFRQTTFVIPSRWETAPEEQTLINSEEEKNFGAGSAARQIHIEQH